jgi:hypothetical protein
MGSMRVKASQKHVIPCMTEIVHTYYEHQHNVVTTYDRELQLNEKCCAF